jgi:hypothetical protein
MTTNNTLLDHARDYADEYGWAVFPVRGKIPACQWKGGDLLALYDGVGQPFVE